MSPRINNKISHQSNQTLPKSNAIAHSVTQEKIQEQDGLELENNRPEVAQQKKIRMITNQHAHFSASLSPKPKHTKNIQTIQQQPKIPAQPITHGNMPFIKHKPNSIHKKVHQLKPYVYQDNTGKQEMNAIAKKLSDIVDIAKNIVDTNPMLVGVDGRGTGYLGAWVVTFQEFMDTQDVPDFFYARYGYAIETLATAIFKSEKIDPYQAIDQVTYGATRPDFVIRKSGSDVGWLDITSEGSPGHIFNKQGGGWKTKPYVAEIRYQMPSPDDFAKTATGKLTEKQLSALKSASSARAQLTANLAKGRDTMATIFNNAIETAFKTKGSGLAKAEVKTVVRDACQHHLGGFIDKPLTYKQSAGVLSNIENLEVSGENSTGHAWAVWAFGEGGDVKLGRVLLADLGKGGL